MTASRALCLLYASYVQDKLLRQSSCHVFNWPFLFIPFKQLPLLIQSHLYKVILYCRVQTDYRDPMVHKGAKVQR